MSNQSKKDELTMRLHGHSPWYQEAPRRGARRWEGPVRAKPQWSLSFGGLRMPSLPEHSGDPNILCQSAMPGWACCESRERRRLFLLALDARSRRAFTSWCSPERQSLLASTAVGHGFMGLLSCSGYAGAMFLKLLSMVKVLAQVPGGQ